jgi:hypothetical protein
MHCTLVHEARVSLQRSGSVPVTHIISRIFRTIDHFLL